ncbi:MAG: RagB/SusD family nutrient uptake outer membrane protein [Ferruginibacter sp.]
MKKIIFYPLLLAAICSNHSCKKFLEEKSNAKLVVPSTQKDLQALLDDYQRVNNNDIQCAELSAGDFYYTYTDWNALATDIKALYTWKPDNVFLPSANDWFNPYKVIFVANTVLENIDKVEKIPADQWNNIKGQALYHRAKSYLALTTTFAPAYDETSSATDMGVPIRRSTDFNEPSVRPAVQENYSLILADLKEAIALLPIRPVHVMRPSRPAAYALIARTLLWMRHYNEAEKYADSALALKSDLLNFNNLTASASYPIAAFNTEVLMDNKMGSSALSNARAKIDSFLYRSYDANDLRKTVFFKNNNNGSYGFKGSYEGANACFCGIATNEVYLIKAECLARRNEVQASMEMLNRLLVKRWRNNLFVPFTAATAADALNIILTERRKELLMRGLRWPDVKRLNKEGRDINMTRKLNNDIYHLAANDLRFALPIPEDIIQLTGIPQNPR